MAIGYQTRLKGSLNPHYKGNNFQVCQKCGNSFSRACKRMYCSRKCSAQATIEKRLPFIAASSRRARPHMRRKLRSCPTCKVLYAPRDTDQKFCSKECGLIAIRKHFPICKCGRVKHKLSKTCKHCYYKAVSNRQLGPLSHLWKGGKTKASNLDRGRKEYSAWRREIFKSDNYTCCSCNTHGGLLTAHHIKPFSQFPELRLVKSNGMTLCRVCHKKFHDFVGWSDKQSRKNSLGKVLSDLDTRQKVLDIMKHVNSVQPLKELLV